LKQDSGCWRAFLFQGRSSVSWRWRTFRMTEHQQNDRKRWRKFENSYAKAVTRQSMSLQTLLGSVMEVARDPGSFITTVHLPTHPWEPQSLWLTITWLSHLELALSITQKPSNSECCAPSSEPFRVTMVITPHPPCCWTLPPVILLCFPN
jgi:hypothetical protein